MSFIKKPIKKNKGTTLVYSGIIYGYSMLPLITPGEKVYFKKIINFDEVNTGDIIIFLNLKKKLISHRIIKIQKDYIITKGDNCIIEDKPIQLSQCLGKVYLIEGKYGSIYLNNYIAKIISFYLYFVSFLQFLTPIKHRGKLLIFFRGRRFLIRTLAFLNLSA